MPIATIQLITHKVYWKARVGYNTRWIVEFVISAFKRLWRALQRHEGEQDPKSSCGLQYNKWRDEVLAVEATAA